MVTHDQEEAMSIASHVALMRDGAVHQVGTPRDLYEHPRSRYAADFFGAANLFDGTLIGADGARSRVECADAGAIFTVADAGGMPAGPVTVMVRPEQIGIHAAPPADRNVLSARITNIVFLGNSHVCHFALDSGKPVQARISPPDMAKLGALKAGDRVHLSWAPAAGRVLPS
jgi:putrescine transport system ATP-binding protein